jgi:hypothetical protein
MLNLSTTVCDIGDGVCVCADGDRQLLDQPSGEAGDARPQQVAGQAHEGGQHLLHRGAHRSARTLQAHPATQAARGALHEAG